MHFYYQYALTRSYRNYIIQCKMFDVYNIYYIFIAHCPAHAQSGVQGKHALKHLQSPLHET